MVEQSFNPFQPAVKAQLHARVAIDGPTGSGKTWTALRWATVLAGPDGSERRENGMAKIAVVDTERRSARLYAPHFTFDTVDFAPPYEVPKFLETLRTAEKHGYSVIVLDSLSHFWMGEGGVLDAVDAAAARAQGNKFAGWLTGTPLQRNLVDTILGLDMHVIATMRSKMEYVLEERGGKQVPRKIGMAPVQREGLEYEFTIVGDMDLEHRMTITKSRCDVLADQVIQPHRETEAAELFLQWLNDGTPAPPKADPEEGAAFVEQIKAVADAAVRRDMIEWWRERGWNSASMLMSELDEARSHLADLLIAASSGDEFGEQLAGPDHGEPVPDDVMAAMNGPENPSLVDELL